jgi:hypothetical protein
LVKHLLEPTARALGDAWLADDCSEIELTIALSMLQLAGHAVHSRATADCIRKSRYSVLLVTAPGEPHMLGSSLLGDMFNEAGWAVDIAFPDSDESLAKQLRGAGVAGVSPPPKPGARPPKPAPPPAGRKKVKNQRYGPPDNTPRGMLFGPRRMLSPYPSQPPLAAARLVEPLYTVALGTHGRPPPPFAPLTLGTII